MIKVEEFFTKEPEKQKKYVARVKELVKLLTKLYNEFNEALHGELVKQLARSEIMVLRYEILVANDEENNITVKLLANERTHLRQLYNQLMANVKEIRSDQSTVKLEIPTDFVKYLQIKLGEQVTEEVGNAKSKGTNSPDTS